MEVSVRFINFWPGFRGEASFFVHYLRSLGARVSVLEEKNGPVDLEFVSVFPNRYKLLAEKFSHFRTRSFAVLDPNLKNTSENIEFRTKAF